MRGTRSVVGAVVLIGLLAACSTGSSASSGARIPTQFQCPTDSRNVPAPGLPPVTVKISELWSASSPSSNGMLKAGGCSWLSGPRPATCPGICARSEPRRDRPPAAATTPASRPPPRLRRCSRWTQTVSCTGSGCQRTAPVRFPQSRRPPRGFDGYPPALAGSTRSSRPGSCPGTAWVSCARRSG